jgi:hypothetical protein
MPMKKKNGGLGVGKVAVGAIILLCTAGCAAGSAASHHAAGQGPLYQIILGFWHGLIAPVTLLLEIIDRLVPHALPWRFRLYEVSASGVPYDIGFYIGLVGGPFVGWSRRPWR